MKFIPIKIMFNEIQGKYNSWNLVWKHSHAKLLSMVNSFATLTTCNDLGHSNMDSISGRIIKVFFMVDSMLVLQYDLFNFLCTKY